MQKLINVLALASFAVSSAVVGAGAYVYMNREALRAEAQEQVTEAIREAVGGGLGSAILSGPADDIDLPFGG